MSQRIILKGTLFSVFEIPGKMWTFGQLISDTLPKYRQKYLNIIKWEVIS